MDEGMDSCIMQDVEVQGLNSALLAYSESEDLITDLESERVSTPRRLASTSSPRVARAPPGTPTSLLIESSLNELVFIPTEQSDGSSASYYLPKYEPETQPGKLIGDFEASFLDRGHSSFLKCHAHAASLCTGETIRRMNEGFCAVRPLMCVAGPGPLAEYTSQQNGDAEEDDLEELRGISCNIWSPASRFRQFCHFILCQPLFHVLVHFLIWVSAATAFVDSNKLVNAIRISDFVILCFFSLELFIKLVVHGCYYPPRAFFRSTGNVFDLVIVIGGFVSLAGDVKGVKTLRTFRALRPLRSIKFMHGVVGILVSLQRTIPILVDNVVLLLFCFVLFSAFAVEFYHDSLSRSTLSMLRQAVHENQ
eukprot:TRINITY_DN25313_c0_g1_i2.p1 TRINITY_DN25313_c0_g1~~TRINITY_DN25313_c0_g1_i2.p1  ORF type:complete len:365 (+),score=33.11 TRINITY_DN25313_c0_g1_i2:61-1155(+)